MQSELDALVSAPRVITWRLRQHMICVWEVEMKALLAAVPEELEPIEVRPDVGLVSIACLRYRTDHFVPGYREFTELALFTLVQSDLSVKMPQPRFSTYAMNVYSDSPEFVAHEGRTIFTPTQLVPSLDVVFGNQPERIDASDDRGPIASFTNLGGAPKYQYDVMWGQHYNDTQDRVCQGIWNWDGYVFEHMERGNAGQLHQHPFFGKLDVSRVRGCYRQMFMQPDSDAFQRFYGVRML
jgi:hypothetical protein